MAIYLKTNPVAIDVPIGKTQQKIFDKIGWNDINVYGRVEILENKDGKKLPMRHISGTDYEDVLLDDTANANVFCYEDPNTKPINNGVKWQTEVTWFFAINTKNIKPSIAHRPDEECFVDVLRVLKSIPTFKIDDVFKGEKALEDFDTDYEDRGKYHFIKVVGKYNYEINC